MLKMKKKNEKGFTLIELMIVIAIIGILAAIAIPQFSAYRARSYNAAANADVRNIMTAIEAYFIDYDTYPTAATAAIETTLENYGYVPSPGVVIGDIAGDETAYTINNSYNTTAGDKAVSFSVAGPGGEISKSVP